MYCYLATYGAWGYLRVSLNNCIYYTSHLERYRLKYLYRHLHQSTPVRSGIFKSNTETEDDGDIDMDRDRKVDPTSPSPERHVTQFQRPRRAVGILSDAPTEAPLEVDADAHIHSMTMFGVALWVEMVYE
jgi:hypothetical protein